MEPSAAAFSGGPGSQILWPLAPPTMGAHAHSASATALVRITIEREGNMEGRVGEGQMNAGGTGTAGKESPPHILGPIGATS
jgi:hypothetical protein